MGGSAAPLSLLGDQEVDWAAFSLERVCWQLNFVADLHVDFNKGLPDLRQHRVPIFHRLL